MRVVTSLAVIAGLVMANTASKAEDTVDAQIIALEKENALLKKGLRLSALQKENDELRSKLDSSAPIKNTQSVARRSNNSRREVSDGTEAMASADTGYGKNVYKAQSVNLLSKESYDWSGSYFGANVGYELGYVGSDVAKPSGAAGGLQFGRNFQWGRFVFGPEFDIQLGSSRATSTVATFSNTAFSSLRGRGGVAFDNLFVYGTAGLAAATLKKSNTDNNTFVYTGYAAGVGAEYGITDHWSAKAEYLYYGVSDQYGFYKAHDGSLYNLSSNVFRLGVNYRN